MATTITNAFSLNMLPSGFRGSISVSPLTAAEARSFAGKAKLESAVGHAETAGLFASALGIPVACERRTVTLTPGDAILVGQYRGPRLPEGATELPDGASIEWSLVSVERGFRDGRAAGRTD